MKTTNSINLSLMGWFELGRVEHFPTQYGPNRTSVTVDVLDAGFITAGLILGISFILSLSSVRSKTNLIALIRISIIIIIGTLLLINNFGQEWEVGHIVSKTPYKAGTGDEIVAAVSLKIALRGVNITLKANPSQDSSLKYEVIDYNERFEWVWDQGNFGFGPNAGRLQQEFRAAQYKGLPLPILWIVDYFIIDGEGQRYGRFYRTAGWYTHILMWTAFPFWLLSVILVRSVVRYGAYCLGICGGLQLSANLVYSVIRNSIPLSIPFEDETLTTKFGFNYWCTFVLGIICLILCGVILFMDYVYDQELCAFFGVNPLNSYDEVVYLTPEESKQLRRKSAKQGGSFKSMNIPLVNMEEPHDVPDDEDVDYVPVYLKRRTIIHAPSVNRKNKPKRHPSPSPVGPSRI